MSNTPRKQYASDKAMARAQKAGEVVFWIIFVMGVLALLAALGIVIAVGTQ